MASKIEDYGEQLRRVLDCIRKGGSIEFDSIDILHGLIEDDKAAFWEIANLYQGDTIDHRIRAAAGQITKYLINKCGAHEVGQSNGTKQLKRPPNPDGSEGAATINVPGWNLTILHV
jgi:hypothetical protein